MPNADTLLSRGKPKEYTLWMNVLQVAAAFSVVLIHASSWLMYAINSNFPMHLFFAVVCIWAVPVFFMLSGAKLMNYRERYGTKTYFLKRFKKTVIPWAFWSAVALLIYGSVFDRSILVVLTDYIIGLWHNTLLPMSWFFIPLFGVYLCIPLVSLLKERRRLLWCVAGALLIFGMVWFNWLRPPSPGNIGDPRFPISGYLGYAILGYLLNSEKFNRVERTIIYSLGLCGAIYLYVHILLSSLRGGVMNTDLLSYMTPPLLLMSVGVFVLFRQIQWERLFRGQRSIMVLTQVSACGLGIYLIHTFLLNAAEYIVPKSMEIPWCVLTAFIVFSVAALLVWVARKIPVLRAFVS